MPETLSPETVYVLPTHSPVSDDGDETPRYADHVRYLPKEARNAGASVEFATPAESRKYVQHFSIDPDTWTLALAVITIASDWLIFTIEQFIALRSRNQGWGEEEGKELPLKIRIAETSTSRNIEAEGKGTDVLEALRILQRGESPENADGQSD